MVSTFSGGVLFQHHSERGCQSRCV
jgi:hypothetical protein